MLIPKPIPVYLQFEFDWLPVFYLATSPEAGGVGMVAGRLCHEFGEDKSIFIDLRGRQSS